MEVATHRAHSSYDGKPWNNCAMTEREGVAHDLPAFIHTFVDLRQLPTAIRKSKPMRRQEFNRDCTQLPTPLIQSTHQLQHAQCLHRTLQTPF
jgi:hypothetical protein